MSLRTFAAALIVIGLLAGSAQARSSKVIQDPAEYNTYMSALNTTDPARRAAAMEAFAGQYSGSVVHQDALEQAMAAYQQTGSVPKVEAMAGQILAIDQRNVRTLAILAVIERSRATGGDLNALAAMRAHAATGVRELPRWQRPEGMGDSDWATLKTQVTVVLNGAAGFAALHDKDYRKAREFYLSALTLDPSDLTNTQQLAVADLDMTPPNAEGFWYAAHAMHIADEEKRASDLQDFEKYVKARYASYHGSEDGWSIIVAQAAKQATMPAGFAVKAK